MEAAGLILLLALSGTFGGPVNMNYPDYRYRQQSKDTQCARHCTASNKFLYQMDRTYQYQYQVSTVTSLHGASEDAARIDVKATVKIHVVSQCEMTLSLSDVSISRSEPDQPRLQNVDDWDFKTALESNQLRFSFQDGLIENVCPSKTEDVKSLNFKRGILSALQNSMSQHDIDESLTEIDVTGTCPTEYTVAQQGWKTSQFTKTKDLLGCVDRHNYRTSFQSTPFRIPDAMQSLPLLKGSHKCNQVKARDGHLVSATCIESLVFRPFSRKEAGARTETTQKLMYIRTMSGARMSQESIQSRSTLLFDHKVSKEISDQSLWSAKEKLTELCRITVQDIPAETPSLFTDLVYLMKNLDTTELEDIADRVQRGNICDDNKSKARKFFLDALPMVGTTSSVEIMVNMLLAEEVVDSEADLWITSFHFVQHPTLQMISHLKKLLLSERHRMSSLLPVSTLVNNVCRGQPNCLWSSEVGEVVDILNDILGKNCQSVKEDLILMTLRAAGNLGYSDSLAPTLDRCMKLSTNPLNTRVSAAQAYRGITCNAARTALMETFMNTVEDAELRIAAYLGVMQCFNQVVLEQVKQTLIMEKVNQVGSFVWTHLTNLMETSSPYKQEIKEILEDEQLEKEFNMDQRKYSRNYEVSYFSDQFGMGAMAESNLIWSSKSFLPRSAMVNLTVDMFGHSVNLLEVGGRVQGLEHCLQKYFGSDGLFKGGEKPNQGVPSRCVKQQKMDAMKDKFAAAKDEVTASMYFRMFGNELGFHHYDEKELMSLKDKFTMKNILSSLAKGRDISFTQSGMFMDSSISVPTIAGMSLTLSVNGTATVELIANGKMDLTKASLKKIEAMFDLRPSGAIQLSGMMSLDAGATKTGLKMVTTLHTSTSLTGNLDLTNGQVLTLELDTPKRNMDILDVKSEFFVIHNQAEKKQQMLKEYQVNRHRCSSETILKVMGYEICGATSFINSSSNENAPYFPFNGPLATSISLHKKDAPRGFKLISKYIHNKATSIGQLSFDTPGSLVERGINIGYFVDSQAKSLEAEMKSPWKKLLCKGSYTKEPNSYKLSATVLDDGKEYKLLFQGDQEKKKNKLTWTTALEMTRPKNPIRVLSKAPEKLTVDGTFEIEMDDEKHDLSAVVRINSGLKPDPIEIRGNYINKEQQKTLACSITVNKKDAYSGTFQILKKVSGKKLQAGKIEPTILISAPKWRPFLLSGTIDFKEEKLLKGNVQVTMDRTLKNPVNLDFKITKQNRKGIDRFRGNGKLTSQFATVKSKGSVSVATKSSNKKAPLMTARVSLDYNLPIVTNRKLRKNKVLLSSKIHDRSSKSLTKYDVNFNVDSKYYQEANLISKVEFSHKNAFTKSLVSIRKGPKAKFLKDKTQELRVETSINHKLDDVSADIRWGVLVIYPQEDIEYEIKGKHEHNTKNKFSFETYTAAIYDKGKSIEVRLLGSDNTRKGNLDATGSLELSFPAFEIDDRKYDSRQYKIVTAIMQNPDKEYIHTINLQVNDDEKHSLVTKFKKTRNQFDMYSQLQIDGDYPSKLTVEAARNSDAVRGSVEFLLEDDTYKAELSSEMTGNKYQKSTWDFLWPERRIKGSLEGGQKQKGNAEMKFVTMWDADKDPSRKIESNMHYLMENGKKNRKYDFLLSLTTPFENHEIYSYKRITEMSPKQLTDEMQFIWAKQENEVSYYLWILLPPSLERFEMKTRMVMPVDAMRKSSLEIVHKFDGSRYLSSNVKGGLNDDHMSVALLIANTGDIVRNNLDSSLTITSSLPKCRQLLLKLRHNDDGRVYSSEGVYERNGAQYKANLDATYFRVHYQVQIDSKLEIQLPSDRPITVKWVHGNTLTNLNSTVSLNWKPEYDTKLIVGAKANKAEKNYALDILFMGPWKEFNELDLQIRHNQMNGMSGSHSVRINRDPKLTSQSNYLYNDNEFTMNSSSPSGHSTFRVQFGKYPYTLFCEASWENPERRWQQDKMILDASVVKNYNDGWSANMKLRTPWKDAQNIDLRGDLNKAHKSEWNLNSVMSLAVRKEITMDFTVNTEWKKISGQIQTPFKEMTSMNLGYFRKEENPGHSTETYLEIQPIFNRVRLEESLMFKPNFNARVFLDIPDIEIKHLEVKIDDSKYRRGYKTNVQVNYAPDKEIDLKLKRRYNENKFPEKTKLALDLTTPYAVFPSLNVKADIDKVKENWVGLLDLKSGAKALEYLNVKMTQASTKTSCKSDFEIASSVFETVEAGMHFDWGDTAGANLTLLAPSVGRTMIGFKKRSQSWTDLQNKVFAEFNGQKLDVDVGLKHDDKETKAWVLYNFPGADQSFTKASLHRVGNSVNDFDVGGFMQVGKNSRPYNVSMQYSWTEHKSALGTTLDTPYTKELSYLFRHERKEDGEVSNTVYGKYGRRFLLDTFSSMKSTETSYKLNSRAFYKFDEKTIKYGSSYDAKWSEDTAEALVDWYYDDKWIKMEVDRKRTQTYANHERETVDIMIYSPFKDYTDVGMRTVVNISPSRYQGICNLEYMDEKEAVLTFDLSEPIKNQVYLDTVLTLPVENYKRNTLSYSHISGRNEFKADAEVITGKGEHLSGKLEFKNSEEYVLTLNGPVEQFESLIVSGKYNEYEKRINGEVQLQLSLNPKPARLEYDLHLNNKPATLLFKLRSPYDNFRKADLEISHEGEDWKQFKTTAELKCDKLGLINSETSWRFKSVSDMTGKSSFTSSIENMENLKLDFSTMKDSGNQVSHLEVGWHIDKEITVDNSWNLDRRGEKTKFSTSMGVATPFPELRMANMKLLHGHGPGMISESITLIHNSRNYLDADLSYEYGKTHIGSVEIRNPRPMSFFLSGSYTEELFDGILKLNWDKNTPEAHIEIVSRMADRSERPNIDKEFKFRVIHPVRIMGVECTYKQANREILSSGMVTWNEQRGNSFSYDIGWSNRTSVYSQMYDSHIKVGVPQRSVKLQGTYSDAGNSLTTSSAFLWDADKDEKKKVTMATTVENKENLKRVAVNVNLPYINKQMNLDATTKGGYGSTLVDSRAEISYSSDPRKLISVSYVIGNSQIGSNENYNYTMDVTFEHPITDTNIQFLSHVGKVDKVCSAGGQFNFLTARREKKTVAFWAQVDRAKNNMEMKVVTPLKTIGIEGQLDDYSDQYHMLVKSFEDDKQALRLDVVVDERRRNLNLEFNYDQDDPSKMVKFSGRFVNDSALRLDVVSQNGRETTSESMVAVRLNSSNVLHTKVLWRPTLFNEWQNFMGTKVTAFSYAANEAFSLAVDSVGSEVKAKYLLVSQELRSEMGQVFQLMDKEMDSLSVQLETFRTEFRRFYQRNDLHIKDMGDQVKAAFDELFTNIRSLVRSYRSYYTGISRATQEWLSELKSYPIAQKYAVAIEEFVTGLKSLREVLEETLNEVAVEMEKFSQVSYKKYLEITRAIDRKLNSYTHSLHDLPMYRKMMEQQRQLGKKGSDSMQKWSQFYDKLYLQTQQMLQDQFHDMMSRSEFQYMHAVASEVHQQFKYWNVEQSMNMAVRRVIDLSKNLMLMELTKLKNSLLDFQNSRVIVYDPRRGELQFEVHLPFSMKSLSEPPEIKVNKYLEDFQRWTKINLPSTNSSIWDTYYKYVPSLEPSSWVPPFKASAYLVGSQHFITFDKTQYDFLSSCSHVLARDMVNDSFSVVVNYERKAQRDGIKSLCFSIEDLTFDITSDYKLAIGRRETEMPVIADNFKIVRDGDFVHVEYNKGLQVLLNPKLDLYKVTVQGWYHGQLAGLLGKYDNEPLNDQQKTYDFNVNRGNCNPQNMALTPDPSRDPDSMCAKIFAETTSKFRPCFKQVDPTPFIQLCQVYMSSMSENDVIHRITEQYRFVCQGEGVFIGALEEYIPCNGDDSFTVEGTDPIYQSADVLFVVEDSDCNQWAPSSLPTMVTEINKALTTAGIRDNRFGLESYGGMDGEEVSMRTMNGQVFGEASVFLKAVETLRLFSNWTQGSLVNAIKMARNYPFRAGVAKVLVIAPCSSCEVSFLERNLASKLKSEGFIVHVLQEQSFYYEGDTNSPRKVRVYGMDNSKTFTNHMSASSVAVNRVHGKKQTDYCVTLAEATSGSVFDTTHLTDKSRVQQDFIQSFAQRVGWETKLPACQTCTCNARSGRVECQRCNVNSIYSYYPWNQPSFPEVIGSFHDFSHDMKTYFGLAK